MVDAADLKSASRKRVGVRVPSWAPLFPPLPCFCCLQNLSKMFSFLQYIHETAYGWREEINILLISHGIR